MMSRAIPFDTLAYANRLKAAGVPERVAEAQAAANADMMMNLIDETLVTKQDLREMESRLINRFGTMLAAGFALFGTLISILHLLH